VLKISQLRIAYTRHNLVAGLIVLLVIIAIVLGSIFHSQIKNQLNDWKLLPQPESLTELYFTKPNNLPSSYIAGQSQTVRFTVHNQEYKTMTYHYLVVEQSQDGSQSQTLSSGDFTIGQNVYQGENVTVVPANLGSRVKIVIELPTVNESIDYWANGS
jgi:uncharacterized membrane protein